MAFYLRGMSRAEVDLAIAWAAAEGWNPGLADADSFYGTDPHGFFLGELEGEPISCISAVAYDATFGFLGFYIVRPAYRGQGYGWRTWQQAMTYLGDRQIGLDGVLAQQENYRKSGFELAYRNIRYQGAVVTLPPAQAALAIAPVPLSTVPFTDLVTYDAWHFPVPRPQFLGHWLRQPQAQGTAVVEGGEIRGYGMIRPCHTGWKIGPLFASTPTIAEVILRSLLRQSKGAPCFWDIPEVNAVALSLATHYGFHPCFETARMYKNGIPELPTLCIFGVTSFELG